MVILSVVRSSRINGFHELFQVPIIVLCIYSLLHVNCFYCEKVATQVFLNGLVLLIEGIV